MQKREKAVAFKLPQTEEDFRVILSKYRTEFCQS